MTPDLVAERFAARQRAAGERADRLRSGLVRATALLRERGARRVVLFGSMARGDVHGGSDIDLLVDGLPEDRWAETWCDLELMLQVRVDLVRAESAPRTLLDSAMREGADVTNETEADVAG